MGLFTKFKGLFKRRSDFEEYELTEDGQFVTSEEQELEQILLDKKQFNLQEPEQRRRYVLSCLEQKADARSQLKQLEKEYATVNAYLQDMEIIDSLSEKEKIHLASLAKSIAGLSVDRQEYMKKKLHLTDAEYQKAERMQEEIAEGAKKLREAEEYQEIVRQDLQRLEGEKQACLYRKHEAIVGISNLKGMAVICSCAVFACLFVLLILQFGFQMDAKIGYILTAAGAGIALTTIYVKYQEAEQEMHTSARSLNRMILLQNKVKIRYINNTNLLDYLYIKYDVSSAKQLEQLWDNYMKEKDFRRKMEDTEETLDYYEEQLVKQLNEHKLYDSRVWIHQPIALMNPKEMVEVRHSLIVQRQKLRKQMEFNTQNEKKAQQEIESLVGDYPAYANEVLKMVSDYEERHL